MRYLETTRVSIADLEPYPGNARTHDEAALDESANVNGQYRSVVARRIDGRLQMLAGHGTVNAFARRGDSDVRVELIEADDTEARRIVLADNATSRNAGYDEALLLQLIDQASKDGGLPGTGWDEAAYRELLAGMESALPTVEDPDAVPDLPVDPKSVLGDVWLLGPHRLACGNATEPGVLDSVLNGAEPGIVYTDPPYGISIVQGAQVGGVKAARGRVGGGKIVPSSTYLPVAGDDTTEAATDAFSLCAASFPRAAQVWWGGNHYAASAGLPDSACWLVWDKENTGNFADGELAWTNHQGAVRVLRHMWNGMLRASERGKRVHPTQKPVALAQWAFGVVDSASERKTVLDLFGGSGSTLMAAHLTGRAACVVELEPAYVDVICRRYQEATGDKPILESTGEPHDFTTDA